MALAILSASSTSAQTKIAYIDTDVLISLMPEAIKVDGELKEYQNSLIQQGQDLQKEADDRANAFVKDSATMTPAMREIKRNEIVKLYQRLQNYEQEAQEKTNQMAQQKIGPIRTKAFEAIKTVAKEKGYGYVLDASTNTILVSPPGDDLLPSVKLKLGIKDAPAGTKPAGAAGN
jgi:outer membrane protein